jgi:O-antigen/teichoic acid export membrane protein
MTRVARRWRKAQGAVRVSRRRSVPTCRDTLQRLTPRGVRRSALISWVRWLASFTVMLLVFPVMLTKMGTQDFGLWAALTVPTNMNSLFGLGIAPAIVSMSGRSLGQARACAEDSTASEHLSQAGSSARAGLVLSLASGGVAVVVGFAIAGPIVDLIHVPAAQMAGALFLFRASSICLGGMLVGGGMSAVLDAVGRVDLDAAANGFVTVGNALCLLAVVLIRPDFHTLALVSLVTAVTNIVAPAVCLIGSKSGVLLRWGVLDWTAFKRLGGLAASFGSVDMIGAIVDPMLKWTVGALGGGAPVAVYELASRAISVLAGSFTSLLAPLMPYYARTLTEHGSEHVTQRVASSSRLLTTVAFPTIALFAVASNALMQLWLGDNLPQGAVWSVEILAISTLVSIGLRASWGALMAAGRGMRLLVVQAASLSCMLLIIALAAWHVLPLMVAAATAFCGFTLVGSVLTLAQYGRVFGGAAAQDLLRSFRHGLVLAGMATLPALVVRVGGANPAAETAVAAVVWLVVLVYLFRSEPELHSFLARQHR